MLERDLFESIYPVRAAIRTDRHIAAVKFPSYSCSRENLGRYKSRPPLPLGVRWTYSCTKKCALWDKRHNLAEKSIGLSLALFKWVCFNVTFNADMLQNIGWVFLGHLINGFKWVFLTLVSLGTLLQALPGLPLGPSLPIRERNHDSFWSLLWAKLTWVDDISLTCE